MRACVGRGRGTRGTQRARAHNVDAFSLTRQRPHPLKWNGPDQIKALEVELKGMSAADKRRFRDKVRACARARVGAWGLIVGR